MGEVVLTIVVVREGVTAKVAALVDVVGAGGLSPRV